MLKKKEIQKIFDGGKYRIDGNSVLFRGVKMEGADPATFEFLGDRYAKDKNRVYFGRDLLATCHKATAFEFLGDYYHGNPEVFESNKYNKTCHKTYGQLYQATMNKIKTLKENGYDVIYIWENDFKKQLKLVNGDKLTIT